MQALEDNDAVEVSGSEDQYLVWAIIPAILLAGLGFVFPPTLGDHTFVFGLSVLISALFGWRAAYRRRLIH